MPNEFLYPGQFELDGVLVIGSSGARKEISALITGINIYQSLDSPYLVVLYPQVIIYTDKTSFSQKYKSLDNV